MSELIVIDASREIAALQSKLASFIFPEPLTVQIVNDMYQELFSNWRLKTQDKDESFPSAYLLEVLGIVEGQFERSYFSRVLQDFQRQLNGLFITHGVFDDLATGPYFTMTVYKNRLRFRPQAQAVNARICTNDFRFSKYHYDPSKSSTPHFELAPAAVFARQAIEW